MMDGTYDEEVLALQTKFFVASFYSLGYFWLVLVAGRDLLGMVG
jgi:hypothetical protein